ncbi:MAG: DUF1476 domain-containing protein [Allosphingosinicella sp.]|uniref:DUF1476 domain-containing protein n=1 Tax=Allosphingosinicella sp. TaxID=2823234 RepID=UPI00394B0FC1
MTTFDERERAFEAKFARDQEMQFRIHARRDRLLGLWAAERMGLTDTEADTYASDLIRSDFETIGDDDVVRRLMGDFTAAGIDVDEAEICARIEEKTIEARRQLIETME